MRHCKDASNAAANITLMCFFFTHPWLWGSHFLDVGLHGGVETLQCSGKMSENEVREEALCTYGLQSNADMMRELGCHNYMNDSQH